MIRSLPALAAAVATLAVLLAPAAMAQDPYPPGASVTCPVSAIEPGDTVTCEAGGFAPGSEVDVLVEGAGWSYEETVIADEFGVAGVEVVIPPDAQPGPVTVTFTGVDAAGNFLRTAVTVLTVVAPGGSGPGTLTGTGARVSRMLALGVAAVVLGGGVVALTSLRRRGAP